MRNKFLAITTKELWLQMTIALLIYGVLTFLLPPSWLKLNLWAAQPSDKVLTTEYVVVMMVILNFVRLTIIASHLLFTNSEQQKQVHLSHQAS
ncbi:hypothetical protein WJR50_13980 [Catalinimonas sp. 4WD22]|uniref:hypothetical protein n=1 Tax=Catalinimonas locisalis TaxID=3133978 RepID=UPI0031017B82